MFIVESHHYIRHRWGVTREAAFSSSPFGVISIYQEIVKTKVGYLQFCRKTLICFLAAFPRRKAICKALRGGAVWSARRAHNPKVVGSNPAPATKITGRRISSDLFFFLPRFRLFDGGQRRFCGPVPGFELRFGIERRFCYKQGALMRPASASNARFAMERAAAPFAKASLDAKTRALLVICSQSRHSMPFIHRLCPHAPASVRDASDELCRSRCT